MSYLHCPTCHCAYNLAREPACPTCGLRPGVPADPTEAVVAAAREAMTNAAKFGGGSTVDVYAKSTPGRLQVFVRDRGPGFDLAGVPADRRGVRESIVGRMERHGGQARITSTPDGGTEVELVLEAER